MVETGVFGYCKRCDTVHHLGEGGAREHGLALMAQLREHKRLDFESATADPRYRTDCLYGEHRGQMFGVLECDDAAGQTVVLKAFSCQQDGNWEVPGWAPPLVPVEPYMAIIREGGDRIKAMSAAITQLDGAERAALKAERKALSQNMMRELHGLYRLHNGNGEVATLEEAFVLDKGIPTGSGDCCAPKLLNWAAMLGLKPKGIAEFYWGRETKSGNRQEGEFYPSCEDKCQPILGFLLCGGVDG